MFSSSRFGVLVSVVPNIFTIYPQPFLMPESNETLMGSLWKFFGIVTQTFFDGKLWYHLICTKIFRHSDFFEALKWCPRNFSAPSDQNFSTEKRDTPLLIHKTFRHQNFIENSRIPLRSFSALWEKNFSTESSVILFLCIKFCDTRIFLKQRNRSATTFFGTAWQKFSTEKRDTPSVSDALNLTKPQFLWNIEGVLTNTFYTVTPNFSDRKTWYPLLCISFFDTPIFLKQWRDAHEIIRHCGTKIFRGKNVIPATLHKTFRYQSFSGKQKGSSTKLFVSVLWDKKFRQNRDAPPARMHENFRIKKYFETKIFLAWNFLAMWDKIFSTENRGNSPPPIHNFFFATKNFVEHRMVPWWRLFGPVR